MMMVRNFVIEKPVSQLVQAAEGDTSDVSRRRNTTSEVGEFGKLTVADQLTTVELMVTSNAEFQGKVDLKGQVIASTVQVSDLTVSNSLKAQDIEVATAKVITKLVVQDLEIAGVIKGNDSIRGRAVIKAGESEVVVKTAKVTANSKVYLTIGSGDFAAVKVKAIEAGEGFTIVAKEAVVEETEVNWLVVE
jgi:hypothetical protein